MNRVAALLMMVLAHLPVGFQAQVTDKRIMSDADYKALLLQMEATLPKWEAAFKSIDPEKVPNLSYSQGKSFIEQRDVGLMEIGNIRLYVAKQRVKHTVSGELALKGFLDSLFDVGEEIVWEEGYSGLTLTSPEKLAPELSELNVRIGNDVLARVSLLEEGNCP